MFVSHASVGVATVYVIMLPAGILDNLSGGCTDLG